MASITPEYTLGWIYWKGGSFGDFTVGLYENVIYRWKALDLSFAMKTKAFAYLWCNFSRHPWESVKLGLILQCTVESKTCKELKGSASNNNVMMTDLPEKIGPIFSSAMGWTSNIIYRKGLTWKDQNLGRKVESNTWTSLAMPVKAMYDGMMPSLVLQTYLYWAYQMMVNV